MLPLHHPPDGTADSGLCMWPLTKQGAVCCASFPAHTEMNGCPKQHLLGGYNRTITARPPQHFHPTASRSGWVEGRTPGGTLGPGRVAGTSSHTWLCCWAAPPSTAPPSTGSCKVSCLWTIASSRSTEVSMTGHGAPAASCLLPHGRTPGSPYTQPRGVPAAATFPLAASSSHDSWQPPHIAEAQPTQPQQQRHKTPSNNTTHRNTHRHLCNPLLLAGSCCIKHPAPQAAGAQPAAPQGRAREGRMLQRHGPWPPHSWPPATRHRHRQRAACCRCIPGHSTPRSRQPVPLPTHPAWWVALAAALLV